MGAPSNGHALLVVDMQTDLLAADGRFPVGQAQVGGLLAATNAAIEGAHERGAKVAYISNAYHPWDPGNLFRGGCCVRGRPGSEVDERVRRDPDAPSFDKWRGNAFCNASLAAWLEQEGIVSLAVAGVYADACVLSTVKGALGRGLRVTVLEDAVAAAHDAARRKALLKMEGAGATVAPVQAWLASEGEAA